MYSTLATLAHLGDGDGYDHMWGGGTYGWIWGALMMTVMIVAIGALVVWLVRGGAQSPAPRPPDPTHDAKAILARRLAEGDITPDEYKERLSHLG